MITVQGKIKPANGLPFSVYGFHLLERVGGVLRLLDVEMPTVATQAHLWRKKTGHSITVLERDGAVWVLRTA